LSVHKGLVIVILYGFPVILDALVLRTHRWMALGYVTNSGGMVLNRYPVIGFFARPPIFWGDGNVKNCAENVMLPLFAKLS